MKRDRMGELSESDDETTEQDPWDAFEHVAGPATLPQTMDATSSSPDAVQHALVFNSNQSGLIKRRRVLAPPEVKESCQQPHPQPSSNHS